MEPPWLTAIKRIHALAESGSAFPNTPFDQERYEEIAALARQLLAQVANMPVQTLGQFMQQDIRRYVTPQVEVRGAVLREDKILLVREKTDGRWTLPGGYADVGLSPAENTEKEIWEEAGLKVHTQRIYALRHKARGDYPPDVRDFYKLYFLCQPTDLNAQPSSGMETSDAGYFALDQLPELSTGRVIVRDLQQAFEAAANPNSPTLFD